MLQTIGQLFADLWDMLCQVWDFAIGLVSGLYLALDTLLTSLPLVTRIAGYCGAFLSASLILFCSTYLIKFLIGR